MENLILLLIWMMGLCAALLIGAVAAALLAVWAENKPRRSMAVKPFRVIKMWNL